MGCGERKPFNSNQLRISPGTHLSHMLCTCLSYALSGKDISSLELFLKPLGLEVWKAGWKREGSYHPFLKPPSPIELLVFVLSCRRESQQNLGGIDSHQKVKPVV